MLVNIVIIIAFILNVTLIVIFIKMAANVKKIKEHLINDELIKIKDMVLKAKLKLKLGNKLDAYNHYIKADFYLDNFRRNNKPTQESMGIVEYRDLILMRNEIKRQIEELEP